MIEQLNVSVEIKGQNVKVGTLTGNDPLITAFAYDEEYLAGPHPRPISVSLPLQEEPFSAEKTRIFFEGLLPEGFTRRSVAQMMRVDSGDYLSILHGLGKECLGAITINTPDEEPFFSFEKLTMDQVHELAAEGATKSAELVTKAHLSLTGASGKVGLYYDAPKDTWYLPKGNAPSTHIVKQSHIRLDGIVTNEQLALMTACKLGLDVPYCFIINVDGTEDGDVLFASERYDRKITADSPIVDGLKCPLRLHQEDFSQAMAVAAQNKYEHDCSGYFKTMFDILKKHSSNPINDQLKLWDTIVFDYLVGNTDNHIKNVSLLYNENLDSVRLAPAYDILSTVVYDTTTREMGFAIGGKYLINEITRDSFRLAAAEIGLGEKIAMKRFDTLANGFKAALDQSAIELEELGFEKAKYIRKRILKNGGYGNL